MNDRDFGPEEFERLLGLPEDHPERVRVEQSDRFIAWKHMLETFERPPDGRMPARERAEAEANLARRVEAALARGGVAGPSRPVSPRRSWLEAMLGGRSLRPALAIAMVLIVAAAGWWSVDRMRERPAVRGAGEATRFDLRATPLDGGLELRWAAIPGARRYALVFFGSDLTEMARVDSLEESLLTLRATNRPAGLVAGQSLMVQVTAFRAMDEVASKPIAIRVP
jgi:hypothetical protein